MKKASHVLLDITPRSLKMGDLTGMDLAMKNGGWGIKHGDLAMRRGGLPGLTIKNDRLAMKHAGFGWFCHEKAWMCFLHPNSSTEGTDRMSRVVSPPWLLWCKACNSQGFIAASAASTCMFLSMSNHVEPMRSNIYIYIYIWLYIHN